MGHQPYGGQAYMQQPMQYAGPQWQPQPQYPPAGWGPPVAAPGYGYPGPEHAPAVQQPWEGPPAPGQPGFQQPPPAAEVVPPGVVVQGPGEEKPLFDYDIMDARDLFLPPGWVPEEPTSGWLQYQCTFASHSYCKCVSSRCKSFYRKPTVELLWAWHPIWGSASGGTYESMAL
jgi:hypothetical protein